jgi:hypothetical protein
MTLGEGEEARASNDFAKAEDAAVTQSRPAPVKDLHLALLEMVLKKRATTVEKWASGHRLGRTTVFDWKACRSVGKSSQGKVSGEKSADIEAAIGADAAELGLMTRTGSDSSE